MSRKEPECCSICTEAYTTILRKKCTCKYCNVSTCSKCIERYLLDRHEDAHCLHCRVNYNDSALHDICTKTYLKHTYFKHRQEVLVNRERANLPGLQDTAINESKRRDNEAKNAAIRDEIKVIEHERDIVMSEYNKLYSEHYANKNPESRFKLDELLAKIEKYRINIAVKRMEIQLVRQPVEKEEKEEKKKFIRRCTRDNCQGFLSTAWKCGICEYYSCSKCFKTKTMKHDDPHECLKDDLDTADLIKKDCKPCPKCGEFIMKSSGCFAPNTPILLFDGSYKMSQHIVVGDELVGDDDLKRTVLETCSGVDTMYEVAQSCAMNYTVNSKHTLVLKYRAELIPYLKDGIWYVEWFDRKECVGKIHTIGPNSCFSEFKSNATNEFIKTVNVSADIEIMVEDYMKLDDCTKEKLFGFKMQDSLMGPIRIIDILTLKSNIKVKELGLGEYYGWKVDSNNRFLLTDETVLRNCSQMWCISCKTPWDWITGKMVTSGPIHNPLYLDWMRRNGNTIPRNPADVPCGGYPDGWELRKMPKNMSKDVSVLFYEFHRICMELHDISQHNYRSHIDNTTNDINIRFLLGDFDEKHWGQQLAKNERKRKRDSEVQEIFAAFRMVAVELINRVQHYHYFSTLPINEAEAFIISLDIEIKALINMINDALSTISMHYSYSVPYIKIGKYYSIQTKNFSKKKEVE